jgi:hypothetical protein
MWYLLHVKKSQTQAEMLAWVHAKDFLDALAQAAKYFPSPIEVTHVAFGGSPRRNAPLTPIWISEGVILA